jgi:hypothetical protein
MLRRALSVAGLLLAVAGFVTFVGLGVGAWVAKREADRQAAAVSEKAHQAGDIAERVIALVREIIARARGGLAVARSGPADAAGAGAPLDPVMQMVVWKAKRDLPGDVARARDAVGTASEALIVAEAALNVFQEQPVDGTALGVGPGDMQAAKTQLDAAASDLKTARRVLGVPIPHPDGAGGATPEQLSNVEAALARATEVTDRFDIALDRVRQKVDAATRQAGVWSLRAAVAVSALSALAALGQVFMARACWRGLRSRSAAHA